MDSKDLAIAEGIRDHSLRIMKAKSRGGEDFFRITDKRGTIEIFETYEDAQQRIVDVKKRIAR